MQAEIPPFNTTQSKWGAFFVQFPCFYIYLYFQAAMLNALNQTESFH